MSILSWRCAAVMVAATAVAQTAAAQRSWTPFLGFNSAPVSAPLDPWSASPSFMIQPGAMLESPAGALMARWSAAFDRTMPQIGDADVASRTRIATLGRLETSIITSGHYERATLGMHASSNASLRLQLGSASGERGVQVGVGADAWRSSVDQRLVPASSVSGWLRKFGLSFSAEVSTHSLPADRSGGSENDSLTYTPPVDSSRFRWGPIAGADTPVVIGSYPPPTTSPTSHLDQPGVARTIGEARLRVSGVMLSMGVEAQAGLTMATQGATRSFGSIVLTRWLSPSLALTGGLVLQPPEPGAVRGRSGALLGIRFASGARLVPQVVNAPKAGATLTTIRLADGAGTLEIRAPGAGRVEVSGDFTRWLPVTLERAGGDRFTLAAPLTPGVHRLIVRVDGGRWTPPSGLPQALDPYEGNVGVIVVDP